MYKINSLQDVEKYVKKNKLEKKFNSSFNRHEINNPRITFYSVAMINKFCQRNEALNYDNYYAFLSEEFNLYDKFSSYLKEKVQYWQNKDPSISKYDGLIYLLKKFVIDPVNGKVSEIETKKMFFRRFKGYTIEEPTPEEDMRECFDFKVYNKERIFYFQHKPASFFYGLKDRTKPSFKKVKKASEKYRKPIFFTKKERGKVWVYIRSKTNKNVIFMELNKFKIDILNQSQIDYLAKETMSRISDKIQ